MKRTDLIVGQEYLYSGDDDWQTLAHGHQRIQILDTRMWHTMSHTTYRGTPIHPLAPQTLQDGTTVETRAIPVESSPLRGRGDGVLAIALSASTGWRGLKQGEPVVVTPRRIRAPWAEGSAVVQRYAEAVRERRERAARERQQVLDREARQVADLGDLLGDKMQTRYVPWSPGGLNVHPADLDALLSLAAIGKSVERA